MATKPIAVGSNVHPTEAQAKIIPTERPAQAILPVASRCVKSCPIRLGKNGPQMKPAKITRANAVLAAMSKSLFRMNATVPHRR